MTDSPVQGVKVWDCYPLWREMWAFRARLHLWSTLASEVDYQAVPFVGDRTHRGDPMPLEVLTLWNELPHGGYVSVTLDVPDDWAREEQQRDAVTQLAAQRMAPDDLILLTDADEIVDPRRLPDILAATEHGPVKLAMGLWMCGTRWRNVRPWTHPAACRVRDLPPFPSQNLRLSRRPLVPDAGWHLSYFGTDGDIDAKLRAFAHAECDTAENRAGLARLREHGDAERVDDPLTGPLADFLAGPHV